MPNLTLSIYRLPLSPQENARLPGPGIAAVLIHAGQVSLDGQTHDTGQGFQTTGGLAVSNPGPEPAEMIVYLLSDKPASAGALASEQIDVTFPCLLRLDEVAFPPGAQAYRHVHPGPGFRHLRWGALHLEADDHDFHATPGFTWFEAANSPVRATASQQATETRFVRCMILPVDYEGKPTIQILDPGDADRPKRQVTHRHVDTVLTRL